MQYYILDQDPNNPDGAAVGSLPDDIEPLDWIQGKAVTAPTTPLRLPLMRSSGDFRGDIMGGLITLFSDQLKTALDSFGVDNVDYYQVELENPYTNDTEGGYWIANILGRVECVDVGKSSITPRRSGGRGKLKSFYVDPDAAQDFSLFRLHEKPTLIIVTERLKKHLDSAGLVGVRTRLTQDYDGW